MQPFLQTQSLNIFAAVLPDNAHHTQHQSVACRCMTCWIWFNVSLLAQTHVCTDLWTYPALLHPEHGICSVRMQSVANCVSVALCSEAVVEGLTALLRMGDSAAAAAQEALCLGLVREMICLLDTMAAEGSIAVPTVAQVLRFCRHLYTALQLRDRTLHSATAFVAHHRWRMLPVCCMTLPTSLGCLLFRRQHFAGWQGW
jgi:hypothetical protein